LTTRMSQANSDKKGVKQKEEAGVNLLHLDEKSKKSLKRKKRTKKT